MTRQQAPKDTHHKYTDRNGGERGTGEITAGTNWTRCGKQNTPTEDTDFKSKNRKSIGKSQRHRTKLI